MADTAAVTQQAGGTSPIVQDQGAPDQMTVSGQQQDQTAGQAASDVLGGVAPQRQGPTPQAPAPAAPAQPHTWLGDLLRAIGQVHDQHATKGELIGGIASTLIRGAAAGAAQHGPGAAGKALAAGAAEQQQFQQQQFENRQREQEQQRLTQQQADQHLLTQASLAKSNQDIARSTLDMKFKQQELDEHQVSLAESLQDLKSIPGSKVLGHFDSNKDVNDHLEQVGPDLAKKYAVDLSKNRIQLIPSPGGGFDAVEVPIDWDKQAVGEGHKIHIVSQTQDPKSKKVTLGLTEYDAPPNMTQGEYQRLEKQTFTDYTGAQNAQLEQKAKTAQIAHEQAATVQAQAETGKTVAEMKLIQQQTQGGGVDAFGVQTGRTPEGQVLPIKEYNTRVDKFAKDYVQPLQVLQKTTDEFDRINNDPNQTGAEKVTALLNAVGISGDPLKGKGFRISSQIIQEHADARNIWQGAVQKLNNIVGTGGPITSQQIRDYTNVAQGVVHDAYVNAAQEARRQGLPINFLPKAGARGQVASPLVAKIYLDAAQGDKEAAYKALQAGGYK